MSRKVIEELMASENPFDRIQCYFRYGEPRVVLSASDMTYLKQIEHVKDMWFEDNDEILTRNKIIENYGVSQRHAYQLLQDAKKIWALTEDFDYGAELLLLKRRIDTAFIQAQSAGDGKIWHAAFRANLEWLEKMNKYKTESQPDEPKNITIIFHMDFRKIGVTDEMMAEFELEYKTKIEPYVKKKFKDAETIPFDDITDK